MILPPQWFYLPNPLHSICQNLISNSLNGFRVSSYNCTIYHSSSLKAYKNVGGTSMNLKDFMQLTHHGPTLFAIHVLLSVSNWAWIVFNDY